MEGKEQSGTAKREAFAAKIKEYEWKPYTTAEAPGVSTDAALLRFNSVRNMELFGDYKIARKEAVGKGFGARTGLLEPNSIIVPEITDNDALDAGLFAYFEARKLFLEKKSVDLRKSGRMNNVEESELQRIGIAERVLTGENFDPEMRKILFGEVSKIKNHIKDEYGDSSLQEEYRAQMLYADKIIENIKKRY